MIKPFEEAAWQILSGVLAKQGKVTLLAVSVHPEKTKLLKYLILMNVSLQMENHRWIEAEPVADFIISPPKKLFPVRVLEEEMPALLATLPVLLRVAACADGTSIIPFVPQAAPLIEELLELGANISLQNEQITLTGRLELKQILGQVHA